MTSGKDPGGAGWPGGPDLAGVLNAAGTMTSLGASRVRAEAAAAAEAISRRFVDMGELQARASEAIAECTGAEAGFVTSCSAAGVTLGIAASMTGDDLHLIERLPDTAGMRSRVVMQAGHAVNYGAPIEQAVRLAGAQPVMFGSSTEAHLYQLESLLDGTEGVAAGLYVVSHHCPREGMVPLGDFVAAFAARKVPVVVDLASEEDLRVSERLGADCTVYSSHKFLCGPTAGIVAGKRDIVRAAHLQSRGIGRTMKVGKEGVAGAVAALRAWVAERGEGAGKARQAEVLELWKGALGAAPGIGIRTLPDWTGNPIDRLELTVRPDEAGLYAWELADRLRRGEPRVYVREQFVEDGVLVLDPCNLEEGEERQVADRILAVLDRAAADGDGRAMPYGEYKRAEAEGALRWPDGQ